MKKGRLGKIVLCILAILMVSLLLTACELTESSASSKYFINDNAANDLNKDNNTKDDAIDRVTGGITNLREYLDSDVISSSGYYMGMEFNIDTVNPETLTGGNFRLKIQAHLYTYQYLDEDGNLIYKYKDPIDGRYYDTQNEEGTRERVSAEDIHNDVIRKSDIIIEWYNGTTNEMLIGMYFDGINSNSDDPGNILYLNIQGYKRSFPEFGDTVLYRQLIRLLMSLSVEQLLVAGGIQGDAGTSSLESLFDVAVTDNYKVVLNDPVTSVLFYGISADAVAATITDFVQGIFEPFSDKIDPLTLKYLGFKFSVVGVAVINSIASDMQFFTEPDPSGVKDIMTGAYLTFEGAALSGGNIYNYVSDISFEYGVTPPEDMKLDRDFYIPYEYGKYEFTGNLYIPMLNSNFDALIRTDMQQYDNSTNNVFMSYRDIANGELMIGAYYKNERTYIDISGMEYLYGWIDLNELGFPKVYDESLNLAEALGDMFDFINNGIVSIVDAILSPDKNDKENHLLEYIMEKTSKTEKVPEDIFSKNTVTLTVDMVLIKHVLEETGQGTYTTRQIINILDSMLPYTMDQIAIMLGVANAEIMLDNSYFTFTLNVDTNEITIKLFTNVGVEIGEDSTLIFQLDIVPVIVGQQVNIAAVNFDGFKPLETIYTYSATMNGNFIFSANETVDLSKLLSATIGENSGLNTPYRLPTDAGITFELVYDQVVTDYYMVSGKPVYPTGENYVPPDGAIHKKQGRSSFELNVWITGMESSILIRLASDDVAFSNDVYQNQPERAEELGYVWVSIECVSDHGVQRIPKVKIREDVFMSSMQAYMDGTSIADDAAELGKTEVNLSITSILFALMEDSYVVMEPEQLEITSSNETLQNIFRVKGLIGNIRANAGFRPRVEGLESVKNDYGMYQVGQFTDLTGNSPYDTALHDTIPVYFYDDYHSQYSYLDYDLRVDYVTGVIQVYQKGGRKSIFREAIDYSGDSFFNNEDENNQDISRVRFRLDMLPFIYPNGDFYCYTNYDGEEVNIPIQYVRTEGGVTYIYYLGIKDRVHHLGGSEYCYYDAADALVDGEGNYVYIMPRETRKLLFEYDEASIEITEAAKTQYAPRINGSFMGNIRRYVLTITTVIVAERGKLIALGSDEFYSDEDRDNTVEIYDDNGILVREEAAPIVLYVMEPCEPLSEKVLVNIQINNNTEFYTLPAAFGIDWDQVDLRGLMELTEIVIAPGTMGEKSYPVRIIVTNREIDYIDVVGVYTQNTDFLSENVPVVDTIEIDPYDYILAKNTYFSDINNYNPEQYGSESVDGQDPEYLRVYKEKEAEFVSKYFSAYHFDINFLYTNSNLFRQEVKEEYIAVNYTNAGTTDMFNWSFDVYEDGNYTEDKITPIATGEQTFTSLNVHTYFKGQLIALRVNVGQRILSHIKFTEDDDFDPIAVNGDKKPGDNGYSYGHYVANYFDEESYTIPINPIFVFTDGAGHYYEKVFNMSYISGLASNGNPEFRDYSLTWGNQEITYIGVNGSYYIDQKTGMLINRPFHISDTVRDEDGTIIEERPPITEGRPDTDITSTSVNWFDLLAVYKPERVLGAFTGGYTKINLISGNAQNNGFPTSVLHISVECPKLDVAKAKTTGGQDIVEADDADSDSNGNKVTFTPSAAEIGNNNAGYYLIDPLDVNTHTLPSSLILNFTNADGTRFSKHRFTNVQWRAVFEKNEEGNYFGEGSLRNNSGKDVLRYENGKYIFNLSTEEPMTTKIMARIGSDVSGYEYITVCVRVLSKDPQAVEFYSGNMPNGTRITSVERTDVNITIDKSGMKEFAFYTYYVNTFASFRLPDYVKAYFGINRERSEYYYVTWKSANGTRQTYFNPNSVQNLVAIIGNGDISIEIYLSVVVANHTIDRIELSSDLQRYYVQVGSADNYKLLGELLQTDFNERKMGLYSVEDYIDSYIRISMGGDGDNGVPAGMIGLYDYIGGNYTLAASYYPYNFIENIYSEMSIYFNQANAVDIIDVREYYAEFKNEHGTTQRVKLSDAAIYEYFYDSGSGTDKVNVSFKYTDGSDYYLSATNDIVSIYPDDNFSSSDEIKMSLKELGIYFVYNRLGENIDEKAPQTIVTASGIIPMGSGTLKNIYSYNNGNVNFHLPNEEQTFMSILFTDGTTLSYEEIVYRLKYYNAHRLNGYNVVSIRNKATEINNFEGLFKVNDVVRSSYDDSFNVSENYKISLGTGVGAYDLTLQLVFAGGYRLSTDSEAAAEINVRPYSDSGYAQYGSQGYVLGSEISVSVDAILQNGRGQAETFNYGPAYGATAPILDKWYVEDSTFSQIAQGSFITVVPQSVIYSIYGGSIKISTLTNEGFRVVRILNFTGVPEEITDFNSTNTTGLLIRGGTITIRDIYDFIPMTRYFAGTAYLPAALAVSLGGQSVVISNVNWRIDPSWYSGTGTGELDKMTYEGTYNALTQTDDKRIMAKAEILGWEEIVNGQRVYHDRITISLYICIQSAKIISLPWDSGALRLDTTSVIEGGNRVYLVEADAFNDAQSSAVRGNELLLPDSLTAEYESGLIHTFRGVEYRFQTIPVTSIPYNNRGIDTAALADALNINAGMLSTDHIDLTVNVGLNQVLRIRFRFYDKTVENVTAVIDLNDTEIRNQIRQAMSSLNDEKNAALLSGMNQTRIKSNIENMISEARLIRDRVGVPSVNDFHANMSINDIRSVLLSDWSGIVENSDVIDVETTILDNIYSAGSLFNFVLRRLKERAETLAGTYAELIYRVFNNDSISIALKPANIERQITNYITQLYNEGYEQAIGDYIKLELTRVFISDMSKAKGSEVGYASSYKNVLEASFDYDYVIREFYRIREYITFGMLNNNTPQGAAEIKELFNAVIESALRQAMTAAKASVASSEGVYEIIDKIFFIRLGLNSDSSQHATMNENVEYFVNNHAYDQKQEMYIALRKLIGEALNFEIEGDAISRELEELIPLLVKDNVNSIQNFEVSISAIRRNLNTSVDISSMLNTILTRGIAHFVSGIYMESNVAREIKKVQSINLEEAGYFYIDPYYDYLIVPTKLRTEFDESTGGFAFTYTAAWINDTVSGNVRYSGNARHDLYGYVYTWYNTYALNAENELLNEIILEKQTAIDGKSWSQIKNENASSYNTLTILDTLVYTFFEGVTDENREARTLELYTYYLAGNALLMKTDAELAMEELDAATVRRDFDRYRYNELNANLYNANTGENQTVSMIVKVKDRSLRASELNVKDDSGLVVTRVDVSNPFEYSASDLPNRIDVGDETLEIIWNDVQISPLGNLNARTHTIYGNIKNANGQQVTLELYVTRWEYAGVYINIGGESLLMNPLNFYFSNSLEYSAQDSYEVRFNVYNLVTENGVDVEKLVGYETRTFYPSDSQLLVNTTNDTEMQATNMRMRYVMYWDEMARNNVLNGALQNVEGDLYLGNDSIGRHNITSLSASSGNSAIPKRAHYSYESIYVSKLALTELDGSPEFGVSGEATIATDIYGTLPMSGEVLINQGNIKYDTDKLEVRLLWNRNYNTAISRLVGFIEYAYPDVEQASREQYAISLIMNWQRSESEEREILALAKNYVSYLNTGKELSESELTQQAYQLLMINEKYDYVKNSGALKGGATGNQVVTLLIRYGNSSYIYETTMRVRLLFADYNPVAYYTYDAQTDSYTQLAQTSAEEPPTELFIGVRTEYWKDGTSAYIAEGVISPYDNISSVAYRILHQRNSGTITDEDIIDKDLKLRRIKVTNIIYEDALVDGRLKTKSFVINGVRYESNLISLRVA